MEITQTTQSFSGVSTTDTAAESGANAITSDFETFLRMLTVQLQNQDPLNPVDSADYAVQLATFSGVEQQVQTNDLLNQLVAENSAAGLAQLAGWVGQEARAPGVGYWGGTPVTLTANFASGSDGAQLLVRNEAGVEVYRQSIPLDEPTITWAGAGQDGNALPFGSYQFDIVNFENGAALSETKAEVYSRVVEVQVAGGISQVVLQGGTIVPASEVSALREAAS